MPLMMVCPLSWSVWTRKVGSSCASLLSAIAHLLLVALGLRLDRDGNHRLGELDGLEHDGVLLVADGVAGGDVLQADAGADVAGQNFSNLLALVGVHPQQAADALASLLVRVINGVSALQLAGINADEGQLADEGVGHDLEDQGRERARLSAGLRISSLPVSGFLPLTGGISSGEGR